MGDLTDQGRQARLVRFDADRRNTTVAGDRAVEACRADNVAVAVSIGDDVAHRAVHYQVG